MSYSIEQPNAFLLHNKLTDLCIIDVRTAAEIRAKSLPGAIHIPLQEVTVEKVVKEVADQGKNPDKIFILCQSGRRAEMAAQQLNGRVTPTLVVVEGGIQAVEKTQPDLVVTQGKAISIERQVRIAAGSFVLLGVILGVTLSPAWLGLSGFVGAGLIFAGVTDSCAMGLLLARMPWNK